MSTVHKYVVRVNKRRYPMKTILTLSILLYAITGFPALAALTPQDLDKIRLIVSDSEKRVKDDLRTEIAGVKQELTSEIAGVKQELTSEIAGVKQELTSRIAGSEKSIKEYADLSRHSIEKQLSTYNWVTYIFMPLIVAAIGIPTAIMAWRAGKDRSLEKQVETLTREIETLKQQRIVSP
jgi:nitric oxide reductase activation protein